MSPEELEELGRYIYWIKARQDKDGKFLDEVVEEAVERIVSIYRKTFKWFLIYSVGLFHFVIHCKFKFQLFVQVNVQKMEAEGKFKSEGSNDVLTVALGNAENKGRVRGIGGYVKPGNYFHLPKRKQGRKKMSDEDREREFAKDRAKWEEEINKKHREELAQAEAKWEQKFAMLEAKLESKLMSSESPRIVTPFNNDVGSGQGSCSRPWERVNGSGGEAVKKRLVLGGSGDGNDGKEVVVEEPMQPANGKVPVQPADDKFGSILEDVMAPNTSTNVEGVNIILG